MSDTKVGPRKRKLHIPAGATNPVGAWCAVQNMRSDMGAGMRAGMSKEQLHEQVEWVWSAMHPAKSEPA